jgi:D-glycerate 3-kinase
VGTVLASAVALARAATDELRARGETRAAVIGLSGPQGGGKSTLAAAMVRELGPRAVTFSVDDVYLTRAEQVALAARHPDTALFRDRGYPGTHDVDLGVAVLDGLVQLGEGEHLAIPSYDKGAHAGRGDRRSRSEWPVVAGRIDVVVFEGWMLGFRAKASLLHPELALPNAALVAYEAWTARVDAWIVLEADSLERIGKFRVASEAARRLRGEGAMSDADAEEYIRRFLPAYEEWVPELAARLGPRDLHVVLDGYKV